MAGPSREPASRRVFRALLHLYPAAFRARYRAELLATFDRARADRGGGWLRRAAWLAATLADLVLSAAAERGEGWARAAGRALLPDALSQAIRFAVRNARRAPGFTLAVVVTLGLGIGATTTMYGVADRLFLRTPDGIRDPDRVVRIYFDRTSQFTHQHGVDRSFSWPDLADLDSLPAFEGLAGFSNTDETLGSGAGAERIHTQLAQPSLFTVLGARPQLGRFFAEDEDRPAGGSTVAVLSDAFWTRRFARDPGVLGRALRIGPARYTVVGVAPRGFTGALAEPVDVWLPLQTTEAAESGEGWVQSRNWYWFEAVARLADGATKGLAEEQATAAHRAGRTAESASGRYDARARVVLASLVPGEAPDAGPEVAVSRWLIGVAAMVMLIACANVANLLLLRGIRRRREMAIRVALGIGRTALSLQLLTESALLAVAAAGAAVAMARWGGAVLYRLLLPGFDPGSVLDATRLLGFAALAAATAVALACAAPAVMASSPDVVRDLKEAGKGRASHRLRSALVVVQVALSVVLVAGAGLFLRSLDRVHRLDLGFDPEGVVVGSAETDEGFDEGGAIVTAAMTRLEGAPGIEAAAVTTLTPLGGWYGLSLRRADGDSVHLTQGPYYYTVSPDYFRVMRMRILRGRGFLPSDTVAGAPRVMVLAEDLARQIFGATDPLGECLLAEQGRDTPPCTRVVGLVADHRSRGLVESGTPIFYLPVGHPAANPVQMVVARASGDARAALPVVRRALVESSPGVRFVSVRPFAQRVDRLSASWRLGASLLAIFAVLALAVAALGLHAVVGFEIAERRSEFGIRAALGATRTTLAGTVFRRVVLRAVVGATAGLAVVAALSGEARGLLFRTSPLDPLVLSVAGGVLIAVALAASIRPALRAATVPPTEAMRAEM